MALFPDSALYVERSSRVYVHTDDDGVTVPEPPAGEPDTWPEGTIDLRDAGWIEEVHALTVGAGADRVSARVPTSAELAHYLDLYAQQKPILAALALLTSCVTGWTRNGYHVPAQDLAAHVSALIAANPARGELLARLLRVRAHNGDLLAVYQLARVTAYGQRAEAAAAERAMAASRAILDAEERAAAEARATAARAQAAQSVGS